MAPPPECPSARAGIAAGCVPDAESPVIECSVRPCISSGIALGRTSRLTWSSSSSSGSVSVDMRDARPATNASRSSWPIEASAKSWRDALARAMDATSVITPPRTHLSTQIRAHFAMLQRSNERIERLAHVRLGPRPSHLPSEVQLCRWLLSLCALRRRQVFRRGGLSLCPPQLHEQRQDLSSLLSQALCLSLLRSIRRRRARPSALARRSLRRPPLGSGSCAHRELPHVLAAQKPTAARLIFVVGAAARGARCRQPRRRREGRQHLEQRRSRVRLCHRAQKRQCLRRERRLCLRGRCARRERQGEQQPDVLAAALRISVCCSLARANRRTD